MCVCVCDRERRERRVPPAITYSRHTCSLSAGPAAIEDDRLAGDVPRVGAHQELGDGRELIEGDECGLGHGLEHDLLDDLSG